MCSKPQSAARLGRHRGRLLNCAKLAGDPEPIAFDPGLADQAIPDDQDVPACKCDRLPGAFDAEHQADQRTPAGPACDGPLAVLENIVEFQF